MSYAWRWYKKNAGSKTIYTNSQGVFEKKIINHLHRFYVM